MNKALSSTALVALVGFLGFIKPQALVAQLTDASATTLGLSGNNTATVRGFGAISVNPAGLAMSGSGFSLALFPTQIRSDMDPIRLADLRDVQRIMIPETTKEDWLARVTTEGGQKGSLGIDICCRTPHADACVSRLGRHVRALVHTQLCACGEARAARCALPAHRDAPALPYGRRGRKGVVSDWGLSVALP